MQSSLSYNQGTYAACKLALASLQIPRNKGQCMASAMREYPSSSLHTRKVHHTTAICLEIFPNALDSPVACLGPGAAPGPRQV